MRIPLVSAACAVLALLVAAGCSSASPDPALMAEELPPVRDLSEEQRSRVLGLETEAVAEWDAGDHLAARAIAERALQIDPRAPRALAVFASARLRVAQRERPPVLAESRRAEGEMRRASLVSSHANSEVERLHAEFLASLGHLTAAADQADNGVLVAPDLNLKLIRVAGDLRYELGDERRAVGHYERLLPQRQFFSEEDFADITYRMAQCRMGVAAATPVEAERLPELTAARRRFSEFRALRPQDIEGYIGEAQAIAESAAIGEGDRERELLTALALLEQAAALSSSSPRPHFDRGVVLDSLGRAEEARAAYSAAIARDATHVPSLLNLAANQAEHGITEQALETCGRALLLRGLSGDERRRLERFVAEHASAAVRGPVGR